MTGIRFSRQNSGSEYHFSMEGKAEALCGLGGVELLNEDVTERSRTNRDWQTCATCQEELRNRVS